MSVPSTTWKVVLSAQARISAPLTAQLQCPGTMAVMVFDDTRGQHQHQHCKYLGTVTAAMQPDTDILMSR